MFNREIINIETDDALAVVREVERFYGNLENIIKNFNTDKENLSSYWTSIEATNFSNELDVVSQNFQNFNDHYHLFIEAIKEILKLYDEEEESILAAIHSYQSV